MNIPPAPERTTRPVLERMLAAAPRLTELATTLVARFPASSRLRRRALQVGLARGFAAINRGEDWFIPIFYEPDAEIYPAADFRALGLAECYRGHGGWRDVMDAVADPLPDVRWSPELLIDLGDRLVVRLGMSATGRASGAPAHQTWGSVYHLSARGRIARQEMHWTWEETLASADLAPATLSR